jgi:hypothetical protein
MVQQLSSGYTDLDRHVLRADRTVRTVRATRPEGTMGPRGLAMSRRRCYHPWYGDCASSIVREHCCARPPRHPDMHICACGAVPDASGQDPLFDATAIIRRSERLKAAHDRAARRPS